MNRVVIYPRNNCYRLLETVISVAAPKLFTQIYTNCFLGRLSSLACHSTANFSVQKLIRYCAEKTEVNLNHRRIFFAKFLLTLHIFQFEAIFDELSSSFDEVLEQGKSGVILELCSGCLKHKTKQSVFAMVCTFFCSVQIIL